MSQCQSTMQRQSLQSIPNVFLPEYTAQSVRVTVHTPGRWMASWRDIWRVSMDVLRIGLFSAFSWLIWTLDAWARMEASPCCVACSDLSQPLFPECAPGWVYGSYYPRQHAWDPSMRCLHWCVIVGASTEGWGLLCHIIAAVGVGTAWASAGKPLPLAAQGCPQDIVQLHLRSPAPNLGRL